MSGNVFVGDHILMAVGFDSAGRQLARRARDGVLLSASEHAYGEGITGLVETAGLAAGMSRLVWRLRSTTAIWASGPTRPLAGPAGCGPSSWS